LYITWRIGIAVQGTPWVPPKHTAELLTYMPLESFECEKDFKDRRECENKWMREREINSKRDIHCTQLHIHTQLL